MCRFLSEFSVTKVIRSNKNGDLIILCDVPDIKPVFRKLFFDKRKNSKFQRFCRMIEVKCRNKSTYNSDKFHLELIKVLEANVFTGCFEPSGNPDYPYNLEEIYLEQDDEE